MSTETDIYRIDVQQAVDALRQVAASIEKTKQSSEQTEAATTRGFIKASFAIGLAKEALGFFKNALTDGVKSALEQERAMRQLERVAGPLAAAFKAQADALQEQFGVSTDVTLQLQMMALNAGATREQVDPLVRSVLDWSKATNQDAVPAMRSLLQAVESGRDGVKKLGLGYKSTGEFTRDLAKATAELAGLHGGAAAAHAQTFAGKLELLSRQTDELKQGFGSLIVEIATKTGVIEKLTQTVREWRVAFFGDERIDGLKKRNDELDALRVQRDEAMRRFRDAQGREQAFKGEDTPQIAAQYREAAKEANQFARALDEIDEKIKALQETQAAAGAAAAGIVPPGGGRPRAVGSEDKEKDTAKKLAAAFKKVEDERLEIAKDAGELMDAQAEGEVERHRARQEQNRKIHGAQLSDQLTDEVRFRNRINEVAAASLDKKTEMEKAAARDVASAWRESYGQVAEFARQSGEQAVGFALDLLREQLLANTQFSRAMTEMAIERGQVTDYEGNVLKDRAAAERQLQMEAQAATQKRTAEFLASIAQQAGARGIFELAEGFAALGNPFTAPFASQHFISAGLFFALAGGTGFGAAALSSGRGMTAEEKQQLLAAKGDRSERDSSARSERQRGQTRGSEKGDVIVNVYQIGITGQTRTAQARELERLRKEYGALEVGTPGGY